MSSFNWITCVDLELHLALGVCVANACLESVTSHKLSQNTQH